MTAVLSLDITDFIREHRPTFDDVVKQFESHATAPRVSRLLDFLIEDGIVSYCNGRLVVND